MVKKFHGNSNFLDKVKGKNATFFLAGSVTKTCEIDGITQAGIPGLIHLTPTLDAEFVDSGKLFSLTDMAKTPKGVPTPAIMTRASRLLTNFDFATLDLGLRVKPKVDKLYEFGIKESDSIQTGANIDAKNIINKGVEFAKSVEIKSDYILLGESTPAGTTTAYAVGKALGYRADGYFSSSFLNAPSSLKEEIVNEAVKRVEGKDIYEKLSSVADNMLLFNAGFVSEFSKNGLVVLGGGTQMAAVLLIIDALKMDIKPENVALMTTKWVVEDKNSNIKGLLEQLSFDIDGYYSDFSFANANIPVLKLYDKGEAKEGVGAGMALCYAMLKDKSNQEILEEVEKVLAG